MNPLLDAALSVTRRQFFARTSAGIGTMALGSLLAREGLAARDSAAKAQTPTLPHFPPAAKRVIYLFQCGAPSQMETFDYKPKLKALNKTELPPSVRMG